MDIWVASTFDSLIMLLQTFMYKLLCGCIPSFLLSIYLGILFLDHLSTLYLIV